MENKSTPVAGLARSLLYVPGDQRDRLDKAFGRDADALIVDLEDAVAPHRKSVAREVVSDWIDRNVARAGAIWLRINADTPADDVEMISAPLAGELGLGIDHEGPEFRSILLTLVIASSAAGTLPPLAPTSTDFRDLDALRASTENLMRLGFRGRTAVHPAQLDVINEVFTPTRGEVQRAMRMVSAFEDAQHNGSGVIVGEDGRMVDAAVVRSARDVLARASRRRGRRPTGVRRVSATPSLHSQRDFVRREDCRPLGGLVHAVSEREV